MVIKLYKSRIEMFVIIVNSGWSLLKEMIVWIMIQLAVQNFLIKIVWSILPKLLKKVFLSLALYVIPWTYILVLDR